MSTAKLSRLSGKRATAHCAKHAAELEHQKPTSKLALRIQPKSYRALTLRLPKTDSTTKSSRRLSKLFSPELSWPPLKSARNQSSTPIAAKVCTRLAQRLERILDHRALPSKISIRSLVRTSGLTAPKPKLTRHSWLQISIITPSSPKTNSLVFALPLKVMISLMMMVPQTHRLSSTNSTSMMIHSSSNLNSQTSGPISVLKNVMIRLACHRIASATVSTTKTYTNVTTTTILRR